MSRRCIFVFCAVIAHAAASFAQTSGKAQLSHKLLSVHIKGLSHYKEDQVIAASGLRLGQLANEEDFKTAIGKLGDSGLFSNAAYSYQYSPAGCTVEFQVVENDKLVPVLFDNFVWFSDDELLKMLRARLPLFEGRLPLAGNFSDQVEATLNAILSEKKIIGKAEYIRAGEIYGPIDSYIYKVSLHAIVIRGTAFPGAASSELPALQEAARQLSGKNYLRSDMRPQERLNFLPVYLARGFLKAAFADAQAKVVQDGAQTLVNVSFPVQPGVQYKLKDLQISGNNAFPTDTLRGLVHVRQDEPANAVELQRDLEAIQQLYATKGYLAAQVHPDTDTDDAAATVRYQLQVVEGDVYRMGDLQIDGLSADAAKRMTTQWQMKKGDPFDDSYIKRFFERLYGDVTLSRSFNVVPKRTINQQDKTVSVSLHFVAR